MPVIMLNITIDTQVVQHVFLPLMLTSWIGYKTAISTVNKVSDIKTCILTCLVITFPSQICRRQAGVAYRIESMWLLTIQYMDINMSLFCFFFPKLFTAICFIISRLETKFFPCLRKTSILLSSASLQYGVLDVAYGV